MDITGQVMIFKNEKGYSTTISKKVSDNAYDKMYITVDFKKGINVQNKTKIDITKGWLSFYKVGNGFPKPVIKVSEFEEIQTYGDESVPSNFGITNDDELPF